MRRLWLALFLASACHSPSPDNERLGDKAWHDGRWTAAVTLYRSAPPSARVTAKLADAAFLAGDYTDAAAAWTQLGLDSPDRAPEAASGLARTAAAAERDGSIRAIALAIAGLRKLEPGWPLGRLSLRLAHEPGPFDSLAMSVIPATLAAGPGKTAADSLILALGRAQRAAGDCGRAVPTLESARRRGSGTTTGDSATSLLGWCELTLGLRALASEHPALAESWLDRVAHRDPLGVVGRRAMVGLGDARLAQGDIPAATVAWQAVAAAPVPPDSITVQALERLRLGNTGTTTDSTRQGNP